MPLDSKDLDMLRGAFGDPPVPIVATQYGIASTLMRNQGMVNTVALAATGVVLCVLINLPADITITSATLLTGNASESGGSASFFALYTGDSISATGAPTGSRLLGQTTNDTGATSIVSNAVYTRSFTSPIKTPYSGAYYLGISVTAATTMPNATGITQVSGSAFNSLSPWLSLTHGSGVGGVAPATITGVPATSVSIPYMILS